ncbi:hypothetical protein [Ottowia thiooxydans]|uniref:hypothetical protein n=1 Tax=Ottowia thiooxydans TaxID=219182 RepID=UPI00041FE41C|nr:hypothetical protein [Ottowia thiooxydans]
MSKNKILVLAALVGSMAVPAFAQSTLTTSQTNMDQRAAAQERRAATSKGQLATVTPEQARANSMLRCANLPSFYKVDCEARAGGQGEVSGSVIGGGLIKESVTQVTAEELANAPRIELKPQPETSAAPQRQRTAPRN